MKDFKVYQASGYLTKLVTDASDVRKEYEEISGSQVQFDTPISAPLASLIVDINPVQSGTGDPSPDNIRPITGWTGVNIYQSGEDTFNPTVYTVSWQDEAGTVYGGTVDVVIGLLKIEYKEFIVDENTSISFSSSANGFFVNGGWDDALYTQNTNTDRNALAQSMYCNIFKYKADIVFGQTGFRFTYYLNGWSPLMFVPSVTSKDDALSWLADNNVTFLYPIANPVEIQLTPQEINTLIGVNNIWADTGDVSVKYRTH